MKAFRLCIKEMDDQKVAKCGAAMSLQTKGSASKCVKIEERGIDSPQSAYLSRRAWARLSASMDHFRKETFPKRRGPVAGGASSISFSSSLSNFRRFRTVVEKESAAGSADAEGDMLFEDDRWAEGNIARFNCITKVIISAYAWDTRKVETS